MTEPCPNAAHMAPYDCANRHQCWEPCGELGKSAEHARPSPRPDLSLSEETKDFLHRMLPRYEVRPRSLGHFPPKAPPPPPAPPAPPAPGCQPLKQLTEEDVRRIVREELAKQPAPWALRSIGGHP